MMRLSAFEGLSNSYDGLNQEDVQALRGIHSRLIECQNIAKRQSQEVTYEIQRQIKKH